MTAPVQFFACPPTEAPAATLLAEMVAEMRALYDIVDGTLGVPLEPEELAPPTGIYLVGWLRGEAVAGGGLRLVTPEIVELKRMYVRPAFRGLGLARPLLAALEVEGQLLGASVARLDTGPKQPRARDLYERCGYAAIGNWNQNPVAAFWGEKLLPPLV